MIVDNQKVEEEISRKKREWVEAEMETESVQSDIAVKKAKGNSQNLEMQIIEVGETSLNWSQKIRGSFCHGTVGDWEVLLQFHNSKSLLASLSQS